MIRLIVDDVAVVDPLSTSSLHQDHMVALIDGDKVDDASMR
jgi:hypothetical protein